MIHLCYHCFRRHLGTDLESTAGAIRVCHGCGGSQNATWPYEFEQLAPYMNELPTRSQVNLLKQMTEHEITKA